MRIGEALEEAMSALDGASFESPALEASLIVSELTGLPRMELFLHSEDTLAEGARGRLDDALKRRLAHEPLQYIFGVAYFRDLVLKVGPGTLIPRPETELMVDMLKGRLKEGSAVCELGAGSGAISISLATEHPDLRIFASEISDGALRWARMNIEAAGCGNIDLRHGDLYSPFEGMRFDAIAANLPYIAEHEWDSLPEDVKGYEPEGALLSGHDGLDLIRRAIQGAPGRLKPGGFIVLEIGETQAAKALAECASAGLLSSSQSVKDLQGKERFILGIP